MANSGATFRKIRKIGAASFRRWPAGADLDRAVTDAALSENARTLRLALAIMCKSKVELVALAGKPDGPAVFQKLDAELLRVADKLESLAVMAKGAHGRLLVAGAAVATAEEASRKTSRRAA